MGYYKSEKVLDGCHRIVKTYLGSIYKIKAVIIDVDNDLFKPDYNEWESVTHHS